jgi:hypothetical protein
MERLNFLAKTDAARRLRLREKFLRETVSRGNGGK